MRDGGDLRRLALLDALVGPRLDPPARGQPILEAAVHALRVPSARGEESLDILKRLRVRDVCRTANDLVLGANAPLHRVVGTVVDAPAWQDSFPVIDANGELCGIVSGEVLRAATGEEALGSLVIAADVMVPFAHVAPDEDLHVALVRLLDSGLRKLPVIADGQVTGVLDEAHVTRAYHDYLSRLGDMASEAGGGR